MTEKLALLGHRHILTEGTQLRIRINDRLIFPLSLVVYSALSPGHFGIGFGGASEARHTDASQSLPL